MKILFTMMLIALSSYAVATQTKHSSVFGNQYTRAVNKDNAFTTYFKQVNRYITMQPCAAKPAAFYQLNRHQK